MAKDKQQMDFKAFKAEVLADYKLVCESRQASLLGRKEVLTGKAKFGIFGDGKEVAQIAMAKAFMPGDFRSALSASCQEGRRVARSGKLCGIRIF